MTTLWRLPCLDIAGRPRCLTVRAGTDVTLGWPAAEFASVTAGDARALVGLLTLAERVGRARSTSTSGAATSFRSTGRGVSSNTAALAAASTGAAAPSTGSPLWLHGLPVEAETRRTRPAPNAADAPPGLIRPGSDAVPAGAAASFPDALAAAPPAPVTTADPDAAVVTGSQPSGVWGTALAALRAHFVPDDARRSDFSGRPTGVGPCGWSAFIDEAGIEKAETLRKCRACRHQLGLS